MASPLLNRRDALRWSAGALLSLGLWPGCATGSRAGGSFRFIVVNDIHYMSPECGTWLNGVVQRMKTEEAEFCLLAGDLSDHGQHEEIAAVRDRFAKLEIPTYVQIGNHDYLTQTDRAAYEELFPDRLNYHFEHRGWQFVCLDTTEGQLFQQTIIQPHTLRWVDEHLPRLDKTKPTVLLTHFPLGAAVQYRPRNADDLLERFLAYNLQAVFSGHFHGYTERKLRSATLTTNRCCSLKRNNHDGSLEKGYFVCTAQEGTVSRRFVVHQSS